eukprot:scaffold287_cov337-Pavlova_lutheri.AAC.77
MAMATCAAMGRTAGATWRTSKAKVGRKGLHVTASTKAADLQATFGIGGSVSVEEGRGGLTKVVLRHSCGSSAEVYLFGGCVTSWKQASGDEVLYVRPDAKFDGSKPISGGVPHCFPQFGPGEMQQHGFARNLEWTISSTSADPNPDDPDPSVELTLEDSEYTRAMWDYPFKLVYEVTLHNEKLMTDMRVVNTGAESFTFTAALHTYLEVAGVRNAAVKGLRGLKFLDKVADPENPKEGMETREKLQFEGPVDSVYMDAPEQVELDVGTGAAVAIQSRGWKDVVVWSPWTAMDCYESFVCVENAVFGHPVTVSPGDSWRGQQEFSVVDLE